MLRPMRPAATKSGEKPEMELAETLAALREADVVLRVERERIRFRPSSLAPELIAAIQQHKPEVIETVFFIFDGRPPPEFRCRDL